MCQWTGSSLVQVTACGLFGAKPLPKPMLTFCQFDPQEQTAVEFQSKCRTFHSRKCIWKCRLWNGGYFVQGEMSWCNEHHISDYSYHILNYSYYDICARAMNYVLAFLAMMLSLDKIMHRYFLEAIRHQANKLTHSLLGDKKVISKVYFWQSLSLFWMEEKQDVSIQLGVTWYLENLLWPWS